eukprot:CAMPEP_0181112258 /NCGR_PEP_ID=MMETSP1071-20121207/19719_1 /TAXON_ID=35127 /ORGANISM="Thalassiosira sp., Strain NH16" /LENGTH=65 /DNA_ID=CAMNT_0023196219 /DNA_START=239 /DNA_END=436 /DNA_ORIENTATION=-
MTVGTNTPGSRSSSFSGWGVTSPENSTVKVDPGPMPSGTVMAFILPSGALTCMTSPALTPGGSVT